MLPLISGEIKMIFPLVWKNKCWKKSTLKCLVPAEFSCISLCSTKNAALCVCVRVRVCVRVCECACVCLSGGFTERERQRVHVCGLVSKCFGQSSSQPFKWFAIPNTAWKNLGRASNSSKKLLNRKLILPRSHNSLTGFDFESWSLPWRWSPKKQN